MKVMLKKLKNDFSFFLKEQRKRTNFDNTLSFQFRSILFLNTFQFI